MLSADEAGRGGPDVDDCRRFILKYLDKLDPPGLRFFESFEVGRVTAVGM
jgi:hypothetical protein